MDAERTAAVNKREKKGELRKKRAVMEGRIEGKEKKCVVGRGGIRKSVGKVVEVGVGSAEGDREKLTSSMGSRPKAGKLLNEEP